MIIVMLLIGFRFQVSGSRFQAPGSRLLAPGSWLYVTLDRSCSKSESPFARSDYAHQAHNKEKYLDDRNGSLSATNFVSSLHQQPTFQV